MIIYLPFHRFLLFDYNFSYCKNTHTIHFLNEIDFNISPEDNKLWLTPRCSSLIPVSKDTHLSPYVVENLLQSIEGIERGTLVKLNEKLLVAIETQSLQTLQFTKDELQSRQIPFDNILALKKIEVDKRHFPKIDYGRLRERLFRMF